MIPEFGGVWDGNDHIIYNLVIRGDSNLGLFGQLGWGTEAKNLGLVDVNITGSGENVGSLVGRSCVYEFMYRTCGSVTNCFSTGSVSGSSSVGGLVGLNGEESSIMSCYSINTVSGEQDVGGLVGFNLLGSITSSYSAGRVTGSEDVAGLVGDNSGRIISSFWDMETSSQTTSDEGTGKTTSEMQDINTYLSEGWDFVDETLNGPNDVWKIIEGQTYPLLSWQKYGGGTGEPNDPYLLYTAADLIALGETPDDYDKHFKLMADIDLSAYTGTDFHSIGIDKYNPFTGVFDGNGHTVSNFSYASADREPAGPRMSRSQLKV